MSTLVKQQHYVWAHLLKAWEVEGTLWCHRLSEDRVFPAPSRKVGKQSYFYRSRPLSDFDVQTLRAIIAKSPDPRLRELNEGWIRWYQMPFETRRLLDDPRIPETDRAQIRAELDTLEKMMIEGWHTGIEGRFQAGLEELRAGRTDFYADQGARNAFITFIAFQFFRTDAMRQRVSAATRAALGQDRSGTWLLESLIFATNMGSSLAAGSRNYGLAVLDRAPDVPLVTTDQPVVNLLTHTDEHVRFYFPVSPDRAVIFGFQPDIGPARRRLTNLEAERLNHRIFAASHDQTYASDRAYLEALVKLDKALLP